MAKDDAGKCASKIWALEEDDTESLKRLMFLDWNNDGSKTDYPTYVTLTGKRITGYGKTKFRNVISSNNLKIYVDSIWIYRYE